MGPPETVDLPIGLLTRVTEADAEPIAAAVRASLDHLSPWMPWATEAAATPDAQAERSRDAIKRWEDGTDYIYVLRTDPGRPVIGTFGLHRRTGPGGIEIGYWLHVDTLGRGYATTAVRALTVVALDLDDVDRVEIHTDAANVTSAAIPRRLGYRLDRIEPRDPQAPAESGRLQIWVIRQRP